MVVQQPIDAITINFDERLVVKVCNTSDEGVHNAARNESEILQKLRNENIIEFVAFYEDPLVNRCYLVTKHAGHQNIEQFVMAKRVDPNIPSV